MCRYDTMCFVEATSAGSVRSCGSFQLSATMSGDTIDKPGLHKFQKVSKETVHDVPKQPRTHTLRCYKNLLLPYGFLWVSDA